MLEEDAIRFDTFLKENDKKAHEAIKKAERETKVYLYIYVQGSPSGCGLLEIPRVSRVEHGESSSSSSGVPIYSE